METFPYSNSTGTLPYNGLSYKNPGIFCGGTFLKPQEDERSEFILWGNRRHSDSMSLILEAFWDREGRSFSWISGISPPAVDSKMGNIYNLDTAFIGTEGDLCAISDYC